MKTFVSFLFLAVITAGIVWYENQPQTVTIPVQTSDEINYQDDYFEEPTTTQVKVTQPPQSDIDYSNPDLTLQVEGVNGDKVNLVEVIRKPQHLSDLSDDVRSTVMGCPGVTDRDMVVRVDARVELLSSLPAKVSVDYQMLGHIALFKFSEGLQCDEGNVNHDLTPEKRSVITYWVVLSGVVTPDHPDGNFTDLSVTVPAPNLTLPNLEQMYYKFWGPSMMSCENDLFGPTSKVWLAGVKPSNCQPADSEATAITNR